MKKVIISFVVMMSAILSSNAQVFVGGGLEMNFSDGKSSWGSAEDSGSRFGLTISPQVGYFVNDDLAIGINGYLGNNWSNNKITDSDDPTNDRGYKSLRVIWGVNAFGRYKLIGLGIENLSLLAEGSIGVQGSKDKNIENGVTTKYPGGITYRVNARPVLSYKLSDKLDVLAYCDFLSIGYSYHTNNRSDLNHKSSSHNLNLGFNSFSNLNIGFIYKF